MRNLKILLVLLLVLLGTLTCLGPAHAQGIQVIVDGQPVAFDQPPVMQSGRILVPVRGVFERLGAGVMYDSRQQTVTATRGSDVVVLRVGSNVTLVNGVQRNLDVPANTIGGRTMVPLRFVSETLGADVKWNDSAQTVTITSSQVTANNVPPPVTNYPPPVANYPPPVTNYPPPAPPADQGNIFGLPGSRVHMIENPLVSLRRNLINVSFQGPSGGTAFFALDGQRISMFESPRGNYQGTFSIPPGQDFENTRIKTYLELGGNWDASRSLSLTTSGNNGRIGRNRNPFLDSVSTSGPGPFFPGQTFTVTANGSPGSSATFLVGGRTIPMTETNSGIYVGTYRVRSSDNLGNIPLTVTLRNTAGQVATLTTPSTVSIVGNVGIAGQHTGGQNLPGGAVIVIDQPARRSFVGTQFQVTGRSAAGSSVRLQVMGVDLNGPGTAQTVIDTQQQVGASGQFFFPVRIQGASAGDRLEIIVHDLDANGNEIGTDRSFVTLQ